MPSVDGLPQVVGRLRSIGMATRQHVEAIASDGYLVVLLRSILERRLPQPPTFSSSFKSHCLYDPSTNPLHHEH